MELYGAVMDLAVKLKEIQMLDPKGFQYGAKAHYNTSLIPLLELGVGGYYQHTKIKYDIIEQ